MKNLRLFKYSLLGFMLTCVTFLSADVVWPALFIAEGVYASWYLIIISLIVEGLLFYWFIKGISYEKALLLSCVGNACSFLVGTAFMSGAVIPLEMLTGMILFAFRKGLSLIGVSDDFLTFDLFGNAILEYVLMCLGSALIELVAIRIFFGYRVKQLWAPVLIGNICTYALIAWYRYPTYLIGIVHDMGRWF